LSFLGIGVQPPFYDWGRLLNEGLSRIYVNPAAALAPAAAIIVAGLAFNLVGETAAAVLGGRARSTGLRLGKVKPQVEATLLEPKVGQNETVLDVENLRVSFPTPAGWVTPVRGVSLSLQRGEAVGLVGESGSGKSLSALAVAKLIEEPGAVEAD